MRPDEVSEEYVGIIADITKDKYWNNIKHLFSDIPKPTAIFWDHDVDSAEKDLVKDLSPCFNVTHNINPGQLPKKYLEPIELDLEVTVSDFIPF